MQAAWEPGFAEGRPLFWPIASAAARLSGCASFPSAAELSERLSTLAEIEFVTQPPRPRRGAARARDPERLYDAQIAAGRVPTRARNWHDLLNALVWASFPRAKRALHARQDRLIRARLEPGGARLPSSRTREQDALAMVDEGGLAILCAAPAVERVERALREPEARDGVVEAIGRGEAAPVIFGHALYEGLVVGGPRARAAAWVVPADAATGDVATGYALPEARGARVAQVDGWLAAAIVRGWPERPEALGFLALEAIGG